MITLSNLVQKQQEEIEKLRNKNKDLLRKLRNRVKEVEKLTKYSLYKEEFSRLNARIQKKDKIIKEMAIFIANLDIDENICKHQTGQFCKEESREVSLDICVRCIKQYFESKV